MPQGRNCDLLGGRISAGCVILALLAPLMRKPLLKLLSNEISKTTTIAPPQSDKRGQAKIYELALLSSRIF